MLAREVETAVRSVAGTADVDNTMRSSQAEVSVLINRLAASSYGLTAYDIAGVLRTALAGTNVGVFRHGGDEYDMVVRYREEPGEDPVRPGDDQGDQPDGPADLPVPGGDLPEDRQPAGGPAAQQAERGDDLGQHRGTAARAPSRRTCSSSIAAPAHPLRLLDQLRRRHART